MCLTLWIRMSKIGYTKTRILDIVSKGNKTASEIGGELGLNLSTVSQHIKELKNIGALEEIRSEHFKRWKSYKLSPDFDYNGTAITKNTGILYMGKNKAVLSASAVLIASIILYSLYAGSPAAASAFHGNFIQVVLTDPPSVPPNTDALYLNYSSVSIHVNDNGTSEWIESNASGTVDLMTLVNISKVIARFKVPSNSIVDKVSLGINHENIVINGTEYGVILRQGDINSTVSLNYSDGSEVLVDLAPTVIPMYVNGEEVFVMVSQVCSVLLNQNNTQQSVGNVSRLDNEQLSGLSYIQSNLSITNSSIVVGNGSSVNLNLIVKNNGKRTFVLRSVILLGKQYFMNNGKEYTPVLPVGVTSRHMGAQFLIYNRSLVFANPQYINASLERIGQYYKYATFGYTIGPNESISLNYTGDMNTSANSGIALVKGSEYKISVQGDLITSLYQNVTAQ